MNENWKNGCPKESLLLLGYRLKEDEAMLSLKRIVDVSLFLLIVISFSTITILK